MEKVNELDRVRRKLTRSQENRDMWRKIMEICSKNKIEKIERLRREYKKRSERLKQTDRLAPRRVVLKRNTPMELLTPRIESGSENASKVRV